MPRSSDSVAALASALAKAQAALVNPEKSLTAILRTGRPGAGERSFRYAPLSSGLDIVRKTLGQHEIATVQTTAIDPVAGMVNLTTTLAHSSGEWIASDWPVCPLAETANPQRMGAALTYARRYALFTLVGIAGEDDLDAPNVGEGSPAPSPVGPRSPEPHSIPPRPAGRTPGNGHFRRGTEGARTATLDPGQSAAIRDRLLAEIAQLLSGEQAADWAREVLAAKNTLTAEDAKELEAAFEQRLAQLSVSQPMAIATDVVSEARPADKEEYSEAALAELPKRGARARGIDKSLLAFPEPRRQRNREHLRFVSRQACLVCGRKPSDPHHIRYAQPRALGRKSSDEFTVPLCRIHHRAVHRVGNEAAWWKHAGIDPLVVARKLWKQTRTDEGKIRSDRSPPSAAPSGVRNSDGHRVDTPTRG